MTLVERLLHNDTRRFPLNRTFYRQDEQGRWFRIVIDRDAENYVEEVNPWPDDQPMPWWTGVAGSAGVA